MTLTPRERQVLALLRAQPLLDAAGLARSLGTSKGAISVVSPLAHFESKSGVANSRRGGPEHR